MKNISSIVLIFCFLFLSGCSLKPLYDCKKSYPNQVFFNGFDSNGIHCITKTKYDPQGFDEDGWNKDGINVYSHSIYDIYGYDQNGYDRNGTHYLEKF